jgi:hypothetical protein
VHPVPDKPVKHEFTAKYAFINVKVIFLGEEVQYYIVGELFIHYLH